MRIAGIEIRQMTPAERERIPTYAWMVIGVTALAGAVILVVADLGWAGSALALTVGALGALWLLWLVQR